MKYLPPLFEYCNTKMAKQNPTLLSHGEGGQGEAKDKSSINHSSNKISSKLNPQKNTFGNIYYSTW
jgi:hypothetical protein